MNPIQSVSLKILVVSVLSQVSSLEGTKITGPDLYTVQTCLKIPQNRARLQIVPKYIDKKRDFEVRMLKRSVKKHT